MAANRRLQVTEFDFDNVKANLKTFLKAQTEFKDYDFEGAGMNILLDTLAYNTHYLGFNMNMLANEMFIDSSSLRSSIVSHAKTLGYEVDSPRAPIAEVNVVLNDTSNSTATMAAGTKFNTKVDNVDYQFVNVNEITASNTGVEIPFNNLKIYEGTYVTVRYVVDSSDVNQRFILTDKRSDTSTLTVKVQNSSSDSTTTTYTKASDISTLTSESEVYYLQEVEAQKFEVYFGDDVLSKALSDGNIVILQYVVTNKSASNGASVFTSTGAIDTITDISVTTVERASGGTEGETLNSIKLNAPLDYAAQGRCVTSEDYKLFAKKLFPQTQAVMVFGGESGSYDPSLGVTSTASYGRVYISIKSTTGNNLTDAQKIQLVSDFKKYNVASITPVVIDPEITYVILNVSFKYNSNKTTKEKSTLESNVTTTISDFNDNKLKSFNNVLRHSQLSGLIDETDSSILNSVTNVILAKKFTPTLNTATEYNVYFSNALYNPHSEHNKSAGGIITSSGFLVSGDATNEQFFDDDGDGNLRRYYIDGAVRTYSDETAGTVDYSTGHITINSLNITSISDVDGVSSTTIRITSISSSKDIVPVLNQILEIDMMNTTVTGEMDTIAVGSTGASSSYTTSTSYTPTKSF
ncbi:MAG: hypothetical protein QGH83_16575 [Candidatus Pacebacteria bacterium]|jgi:hypothetical protein|nr:hypothetical protein [Candidatus Paceibacterota bacterium]